MGREKGRQEESWAGNMLARWQILRQNFAVAHPSVAPMVPLQTVTCHGLLICLIGGTVCEGKIVTVGDRERARERERGKERRRC